MAPDMGSRYQVFGDLVVADENEHAHHVSGRQGQILALLLAAQPNSLTRGRLIDEVWGDRPPQDPESTLHNVVSRLRGLVGSDVVTTPSGYTLAAGSVDSAEYEQSVAKARDSREIADYDESERLWAGDPYRGFEDLPSVRLEAQRLTQVHRRATLERLDLMISRGQGSPAADELRHIVETDLLDEEALSLYMTALYASGKKPAALKAFKRYEQSLADETGLESSASIRELEVAILVDEMERPAPVSRQVTTFEVAIRYETVRNGQRLAIGTAGSGPQLVVHPGWMSQLDLVASGFDMRSPLWAALSQTHQLTLFDRGGTGLSQAGGGGHTFEESVEELEAVLEATTHGPVPIWAGSGAGPIAIRLAATRPELVSHLILYGTYGSGPATFPASVTDSMVALVRASWGVGSDLLAYLLFPSGSSEIRDAWSRAHRQMAEPETAAALLRQLYDADVSDDLPRVEVPCLILHYREDKAVPISGAEQLARGIEGARYVPLDGKSHYPLPGEERKVVEIIDSFLERTAT
jgi:pimeloyl-ACP methyl ester carboxylesterase/DNA-binding SARP family transcriptional activator